MENRSIENVRIAAIQMASENGNIKGNLKRAKKLVEDAVAKNPQIVILPEFMPTGYVFDKRIWDGGEPHNGETVCWLKELSKKYGIYMGTTFLESDGNDFFNTFVLTRPDGSEAGRVRKQTPATFEAYFTKGEEGPHTIETEFGLVGIGICYENQLSCFTNLMIQKSVDLMIMPHSAPTPEPNFLFPEKSVVKYNENLKNLSVYYAKLLGIPAVMINKCGDWESPTPGLPFLKQKSFFPGFTSIADSDGNLKAQLGDEEGIIVEDVRIDHKLKTNDPPECTGRWSQSEPWHKNLFIPVEIMGTLSYKMNSLRRKKAKEIIDG